VSVYDTQNESTRQDALEKAAEAIKDGKLIVLPTDTVYGIGADAFTADAVGDLLDAKGRGRDVPPPVLVGDRSVLLGLAVDVPEYAERLTEEFWPGALTLILTAQPSLTWDLGETRGTVALRMPDDETALELLRTTGPLAVSSANRHGKDAALSVMDAATQLGDRVEVYLDGGPARIGTSSTIIDTTVEPPEIVREGALTQEQIVEAVGDIFTPPEPEPEDTDESEEQDQAGDSEHTADEDAPADQSAPADDPAPGQDDAPGQETTPEGEQVTDEPAVEEPAAQEPVAADEPAVAEEPAPEDGPTAEDRPG
jgi:L-threonylcarbamoyladenylate synthase